MLNVSIIGFLDRTALCLKGSASLTLMVWLTLCLGIVVSVAYGHLNVFFFSLLKSWSHGCFKSDRFTKRFTRPARFTD